jgi:hypothetical protein
MSRHELTAEEQRLSRDASERLGFPVLLYRDGEWICQPKDMTPNGYGGTPDEAIENCARGAARGTKKNDS